MRKKNEQLWNHLLKNLNDFEIRAGWFENSRYKDGTPIAYIAAIQNYGAKIRVADSFKNYLHYVGIHLKSDKESFVIPARPFMEHAKARVRGAEGKQILSQEMFRVFEGKQTIQQAVNRLGIWLQGIIQEEIIKINDPKLSGMTVVIRNSAYETNSQNQAAKPLQGSGAMLAAVQYKAEIK